MSRYTPEWHKLNIGGHCGLPPRRRDVSKLPKAAEEKAAFDNGLIKKDGVWYRRKGWGLPDDWDTEPMVRVPDSHARKIIGYERAEDLLRKLAPRAVANEVRLHLIHAAYVHDSGRLVGETGHAAIEAYDPDGAVEVPVEFLPGDEP